MKYVCSVCGYVYDEAAEGVPFASLPDSWTCPLCRAPKSAFEAKGAPARTPGKYVCSICGYIYDEAAEGVFFADLPDTWTCPLCTAPKSAFEPQTGPAAETSAAEPVEPVTDLKELSAGQLSALFSNLARGCEKQYKAEEAALYLEIADYFASVTPPEPSAELEDLAGKIRQNLDREYPALERSAKDAEDRGALRAYTWGLKVTRMQQALISQYLAEGEAFLAHTNVWICTVCGFIYVGDNPPALCPVCKVPDWKFEKIQGGAKA